MLSELDDKQQTKEPTVAKIKPHSRLSPIWLVPLVALGLVLYLAYNTISEHGPEVVLTLSTADGITVDQTQLKHKNVTLGTVDKVTLAQDMKSVVVKIRLLGDAKSILTDHARFWVVRPRLSAGNLTGLETIVSGAYIEVDPGEPGGKKQKEFKALETPPGRQSDEPGQVYMLKVQRLGSLSAGSPIYFRDVEVGQVLSYDLGEGLGPITMRIFVRSPYDKFVHPQTRFWNASGLSVTMGAEGMHVELESFQSLVNGGIAFETPRASEKEPAAGENAFFDLYADKSTADAAFYQVNIHYVTYFTTSVQGLTRGSPVQLFGVQVGSVSDVRLAYDPDKAGMIARVAFELQPERIIKKSDPTGESVPPQLRAAFSETGLRVVLESSNMLTGAKDLSIVYAPGKSHADLPKEGDALVLPSQGGGLDGLTASLSDIATKLDKIPFDEIARNANGTLKSVQQLAKSIDSKASPALAQLPGVLDQMTLAAKSANGILGSEGYGENSEFQHNMGRVMNEMNDAARSFRVLADYLDRHPEALLQGRASKGGER